MVTVKDIEGSNGVVHVIDAVLLLPETTNINQLISNESDIRVFPNPVTDYLNVSFKLQEAGNIDISIYDFTGRKVQTVVNKSYNTGSYLVTGNIDNLSPGLYFISVGDGTSNVVKQISKQ
jgi:hypothetical protein